MTWTKLGDEFADECWTLSDKAFRLHTQGLLWSNRMLTDGQLAKEDMRRWAHHPDSAEELVSVGWWEDRGGHYQIVHHLGYQRTRKQIAKQSIANAKNANRRWSKKKPRDKSSNDSECDSHPREELSNESECDSQCEMDRTGQARIREVTKNESFSSSEENDDGYFASVLTDEPPDEPPDASLDADYAADLRDWYSEDERVHYSRLADRNVRDGYDR
jgi:hypothetical protein